MILAFRRPCADHRTALLDFLDRGERTSATAPALTHLDRCAACEQDLADVALAITGLRRLQAEVERLEPPGDAWPRLRARVTRPVSPWRWRATLGGMATSALLVALLVLPVTIGRPGNHDPGLALSQSLAELRHESAYLASIRGGTLPPTPPAERDGGSVPHNLPPEIAQVRKEVTPAPAVARLPEPI